MSNKIKNTCTGSLQQATCTEYQTELPSFSELSECVSIEETTEELYSLIGKIKTEIDLSELGERCLEYVEAGGKIFVKNVLLKLEEEICNQKEEIEELRNRKICDTPISECVTSFDCLVGACDNSIITLGDWMSAVQVKICTP